MSLHHMLRAAAGQNNSPTPPASTDPQFNYVSMLLHGDGTNGSQNNTFVDSSTNNFTITRNGNTTQGSLSPYGNLWSNYFDGSGDWLSLTLSAATGSTFTVEAWVYLNAYPAVDAAGFVSTTNSANSPEGWFLRVLTDGRVSFGETWGQNQFFSTATVPLNTWTHVAGVRNGSGAGNAKIYVNGVLQTNTGTFNKTYTSTSLVIGRSYISNTIEYVNGYISNVRVTSTAVYTATFTPPTAPLTAISGTSLLTCQSNRFIDNSANNFTITCNGDVRVTKESPFLPTAAYSTSTIGGSGYFNGTSDFLTTSGGATLSGDFTIESWVYLTSLPSFSMLIGGAGTDSYLAIRPTGIEALFSVNSGYPYWSFTFVRNTWYHIVISRQSGTVRCFVNGQQLTLLSGSATNTTAFFDGALFVGKCRFSPFYYFPGYISNLRIVNGTAVYTAAFTPPTAPVTAISGTSLLLNFTNAGIFDNAAENDLETVGNAQISTSVKKYGTGSLAFDGTGDYLAIPQNVNFEFGTGDFTIEGWFYRSSTSGDNCIFALDNASYPRILIQINSTTLYAYASNTGSSWNILSGLSFGTITSNTWHHFALTRQGTTFRAFLNGTLINSATSSAAIGSQRTSASVGLAETGSFANYWNGYIDDLRITKGYARYTANFTPPTAAFPDQ